MKTDWVTVVGTVAAVLGIIGAVIGAARWHQNSIAEATKREILPILEQVSNNGGQSMHDRIERVERDTAAEFAEIKRNTAAEFAEIKRILRSLVRRIDKLYERLPDDKSS